MGEQLQNLKELILKKASKKDKMRLLGCYLDDQLLFHLLTLLNYEMEHNSDLNYLESMFEQEQLPELYCTNKKPILERIEQLKEKINQFNEFDTRRRMLVKLIQLQTYLETENEKKRTDYYRFRDIVFQNPPYTFFLHGFDEMIRGVKEEVYNPSILECMITFLLSVQNTEYEDYAIQLLQLLETSKDYQITKSKEKRVYKELLTTKEKLVQYQELQQKKETLSNPCIGRTYNIIVPNNYSNSSKLSERSTKIPNLVDRTEEKIYTIDPMRYGIFDDAFTLTQTTKGNYQLTIYSADVAHQVPFGGSLFENAFLHAKSIYVKNALYRSMFPESLSKNFSLYEREYRYATAYQIEFNASLQPKLTKIENTVICVNRNFTINEINASEKEDFIGFNKDTQDYFMFIKEFIIKLQNQRTNNRMKEYHEIKDTLRELQMQTVGGSRTSSSENWQYRTFAHSIVEEFIGNASKAVARYGAERNLAMIYRNAEIITPETEMLSIMETLRNYKIYNYYTSEKVIHGGIKDYYMHLFAPIRNSVCLYNQYAVQGIWMNEAPEEEQRFMEACIKMFAQKVNQFNDRNEIEVEQIQLQNQKKRMYY